MSERNDTANAYDSDNLDNRGKGNNNDDEDRIQRCRERNRIHARNTRERKRAQMEFLQQRIQLLNDEKKKLERMEPDSSVASILMSLSSQSAEGSTVGIGDKANDLNYNDNGNDEDSNNFAAATIERLKNEISAHLSDDEELEMDQELMNKEKSTCTTKELEMIRRERNRMHAKKTRLRKKKMLTEMEAIIHRLEEDIRKLRQLRGLPPESAVSSSNGPLTHGGKFTGFRHTNRISDGTSQAKTNGSIGAGITNSSLSVVEAANALANVASAGLFPSDAQSSQIGDVSHLNPAALNMAALLSAPGQVGNGNLQNTPAMSMLPMFQNLKQLHAAILAEYEKKLLLEIQAGIGNSNCNSIANSECSSSLERSNMPANTVTTSTEVEMGTKKRGRISASSTNISKEKVQRTVNNRDCDSNSSDSSSNAVLPLATIASTLNMEELKQSASEAHPAPDG